VLDYLNHFIPAIVPKLPTANLFGLQKNAKLPKKQPKSSSGEELLASSSGSGRQYWLMKAEPESRFEKGKDIKFSIDDLASKEEPEPWDGKLS